jgi:hypothetical protein
MSAGVIAAHAAAAAGGGGYAAAILADSPAVYWKLNETSGTTATDSSGNGRHGTFQGGPTFSQGALTSDAGANSILFTPSAFVYVSDAAWMESTNWTAEFRVHFPASMTLGYLFGLNRWGSGSSNRVFLPYVLSNGSIQAQVNNSATGLAISATGLMTAGNNYTVAYRANGTALTGFINGVQVSSATLSALTILTGTADLYFARAENSYSTVQGSDCAYWTSALSDAQLAAHAAAA